MSKETDIRFLEDAWAIFRKNFSETAHGSLLAANSHHLKLAFFAGAQALFSMIFEVSIEGRPPEVGAQVIADLDRELAEFADRFAEKH